MNLMVQRNHLLFVFCVIWTLFCGYLIYFTPQKDVSNRGHIRRNSVEWINDLCSTKSNLIVGTPGPCPENGIVTVAQKGRLGNQIFEYSGVLIKARLTNKEPFVPPCLRDRLLQVFESLHLRTLNEIGHCDVSYDKNSNRDVLLHNYYQDVGVIAPFISELRTVFKLKKKLILHAREFLSNIAHILNRKRPTFIGVHVRRGDYGQFMRNRFNKTLAPVKYYQRAMEYFRKKYKETIFVVLSDSVGWAWKNLGERQVAKRVWVNQKHTTAEEDFAVLASCNHSIIDYGTYGIWGAILAGGETIVYNSSEQTSYRAVKFFKNWTIMS